MFKWIKDSHKDYTHGYLLAFWYKEYTRHTLKIFGYHFFSYSVLELERHGDRILYKRS